MRRCKPKVDEATGKVAFNPPISGRAVATTQKLTSVDSLGKVDEATGKVAFNPPISGRAVAT